jgi:hypothetical protein
MNNDHTALKSKLFIIPALVLLIIGFSAFCSAWFHSGNSEKRIPQKILVAHTKLIGGGPSMPEFKKFEPYDATHLVDPFSGDFNYNIPLLDVGGYPINLSYQSNLNIEEDAGMVGWGWNLNIGAIDRTVRGLPDDFDGEKITRLYNLKENRTIGVGAKANFELFSYDPSRLLTGLNGYIAYNNYTGYNVEFGLTPQFKSVMSQGSSYTLALGLNFSNNSGASIAPSVSLEQSMQGHTDNASGGIGINTGISTSYNSLNGLGALQFDGAVSLSGSYAGVGQGSAQFNLSSQLARFNPVYYNPHIAFPLTNSFFTGKLKLGVEGSGFFQSAEADFYYSSQKLATNRKDVAAYGYIYEHHAPADNALYDYIREKEGAYIADKPTLAVPIHTYDVYTVSAQQPIGTFRPFRREVGVLSDAAQTNTTGGMELGGDVGLGNTIKIGVNTILNGTQIKNGVWKDENECYNLLGFGQRGLNDDTSSSIYFKRMGEKNSMINKRQFDKLGGYQAVRVNLEEQAFSAAKATSILTSASNEQITLNDGDGLIKPQAEPRAAAFAYLTAVDAQTHALEKNIYSYSMNGRVSKNPAKNIIPRLDGQTRRTSHLSEVTAINEEGYRYVYGIPAYNVLKKEVVFNGTGRTVDSLAGMLNYIAGDNDVTNSRGVNNLYTATITPAYSYAHLLTAALSADFIDATGDGPTPDDRGSYTRFNYSRAYTNFKWRTPVGRNKAWFDEGLLANNTDQAGNYIYGEKEVWYVHSIETKNYIAEFKYSLREDAFGVKNEQGDTDMVNRLYKLDTIILYSRMERLSKGAAAIPIKSVVFNYRYDLCQGLPNAANGGGKLTLKRVSFIYKNSKKGLFSPYQFGYQAFNPQYKSQSTDRWGTYKPQRRNEKMPNHRFPFTTQKVDSANLYASAWLLNEITMPNGGKVSVVYESDQYAYVQNKKAMQMLRVAGFASQAPTANVAPAMSPRLYRYSNEAGAVNDCIYFWLNHPVSLIGLNKDSLKNMYISGIEELYFSSKVNVKNNLNEEIEGFIHLNPEVEMGFAKKNAGDALATLGYIRVPLVPTNTLGIPPLSSPLFANGTCPQMHPISKLAWQFLRINQPSVLYGNTEPIDMQNVSADMVNITNSVVSAGSSVADVLLGGFENHMAQFEIASSADTARSYIRLNHPQVAKLGGGVRVKELKLDDRWQVANKSYTYRLVYDYTTPDEKGRSISSGVASYEPMIGKQENPWVLPVRYKPSKWFSPADELYTTEPFGEAYFPGASVGYSKVSVKTIGGHNGYTNYEYYTTKDFPVITNRTTVQFKQRQFVMPVLIGLLSVDQPTVSQGFYIELNDMNGRLKRSSSVNENGEEVTSSNYIYRQKDGRLDNEVKVLQANGVIEKSTVGVEWEVSAEANEFSTFMTAAGVEMNTDNFVVVVPVILPIPIPSLDIQDLKYRSMVMTKVVQRTGLLDSIIFMDQGTYATTVNEAYNPIDGDVVIRKTYNEFDKPLYHINIAAYTEYDGLGAAANAINYRTLPVKPLGNSFSSLPRLRTGDEVMVYEESVAPYTAWAVQQNGGVYFINHGGDLITQNSGDHAFQFRVIRPAKRNMLSASSGYILTLNDPTQTGNLLLSGVLEAKAAEYNDEWNIYERSETRVDKPECVCSKSLSDTFNVLLDMVNRIIQAPARQVGSIMDLTTLISNLVPYRKVLNGIGQNASSYRYSQMFQDTSYIGKIDALDPRNNVIKTLQFKLSGDSIFEYLSKKVEKETTPLPMLDNGCVDVLFDAGMVIVTKSGSKYFWFDNDIFASKRCSTVYRVPIYVCGLNGTESMNPFHAGVKGNFKPKRNFKYHTERGDARIDVSGVYNNFTPFWNSYGLTKNRDGWNYIEEDIVTDPYGNVLETKDVLNRSTAEIYAYNGRLNIAAAKNSKLNQLYFENFEDMKYHALQMEGSNVYCDNSYPGSLYSSIASTEDARLTQEASHTGRYSMALTAQKSIVLTGAITNGEVQPPPLAYPYRFNQVKTVSPFAPSPGLYYISGWIYVRNKDKGIETKTANIQARQGTRSGRVLKPVGPVIDGWQQVADTVTIYALDTLKIAFNADESQRSYFDDIRVQPFSSSMKCFVYSSTNMTLEAMLDENNFAIFYEYDEEGRLVRTKRETEKGIMTTEEFRVSAPKVTLPLELFFVTPVNR